MSSVACSHGDWTASRILQDPFGGPAQAPVVFEPEDHAAFLRLRQALRQAVDDPLKPFVIRVAGRRSSIPLFLISSSKVFVVPQRPVLTRIVGDAERVGELDTRDRVVDVLLDGPPYPARRTTGGSTFRTGRVRAGRPAA